MAPAATVDDNTRSSKSNGLHGQSPLRANIVLEEAQGPLVWQGQFLSEDDFVVRLDIQDILELEEAVTAFDKQGLAMGLIAPDTFVLPILGPKLFQLKQRLYDGLGFFVLRGLEPGKYNTHTNMLLYAGIASYIGDKRAIQYEGGPALTHVVDLSAREDAEKNSGVYVGQANKNLFLPFHTDEGHILALYSIHSACKGGQSRLASSWTIYNNLKRNRPDIVELLRQPWEWASFRDDKPSFHRPLLFQEKCKVILKYTRRHFLGSPGYPRHPQLRPISDRQLEALEVLEETAGANALVFEFLTGDIQFVNNLAVLHGRESFMNSEMNGCRRHLLRLFLKDETMAWKVPSALSGLMSRLYDHDPIAEEFPWSLGPLPYVLSP